MEQQKRIQLVSMRMQVRSLASVSGSGIHPCRELWCRLQTRLRFGVAMAVAVAGIYSSNLTPSLQTSICLRCGPKKQKRKREREEKTNKQQQKNQVSRQREIVGLVKRNQISLAIFLSFDLYVPIF